MADGETFAEIDCPSCGSSFSLLGERTGTYAPGATKTIAHFVLIDQVGAGAFGAVWMARDTQLDRVVAIKIPRAGQLTAAEAEQFLREARAAAQLSHPNIVSVHEVGRWEDAVYIVSDFVRGVTLSDWLTGQTPTSHEAAELCAKIAEALDHAHRAGVVHRDLKPGNVMLDGDGEPHIMDFGLAKREAGEVTMTVDGKVLGTPAYMSPEQARGEGHSADRRSDVYSLGVILFQLLTGELPFRGTPRMLLHQVLNDEPRAPRSLNDRVPRDVQTICLKAMAKDASRRYATAADMAADLRRFLAGEAIHARPVGRVERAWRWTRRNPALAGLTASVLLLLSAVAMTSTVAAVRIDVSRSAAERAAAKAEYERRIAIEAQQAERVAADAARQAQQAANEQAQRAELEAESAEAVADFLVGLFSSSDAVGIGGIGFAPGNQLRSDAMVGEVLELGLKRVNEELGNRPQIKARLLDAIGVAYMGLGMIREAAAPLEQSLELRRADPTATPLELAASLSRVGAYRLLLGYEDESERLLREALRLAREAVGDEHADVATIKFLLGWQLADAGEKLEESEQLFREAVATRRALRGRRHRDVAVGLIGLSVALFAREKDEEGLVALVEAGEILASVPGGEGVADAMTLMLSAIVDVRNDQIESAGETFDLALDRMRQVLGESNPLPNALQLYMGITFDQEGHLELAEKLLRDAEARFRRSFGSHPRHAQALRALAICLDDDDRPQEAVPLVEEAYEIFRDRLGADNIATAEMVADLAVVLDACDRTEEADEALGRAMEVARARWNNEDTDTSDFLASLAAKVSNVNGAEAAERLYRRAIDIGRAVGDEGTDEFTTILNNFGVCLHRVGKFAEAEPIQREVLRVRRQQLRPDHPTLSIACGNLADTLLELDQHAEAEQLYREAVDIDRVQPDGELDLAGSLEGLADAHAAQSHYDQAATAYREALDIRRQHPDAESKRIARVLEKLARAYERTFHDAEAEGVLREALEIRRADAGDADPLALEVEGRLGTCLARLGRFDEAEPLLLHYRDALGARADEEEPLSDRDATERLIELYRRWGRTDQQSRWQAQLDAMTAGSADGAGPPRPEEP